MIFICCISKFLKNNIFCNFDTLDIISKFLHIVFFCFILLVFFHAQSHFIYYLNIGSYYTKYYNYFCFLVIFYVCALESITKWPISPQTFFTPHYPIKGWRRKVLASVPISTYHLNKRQQHGPGKLPHLFKNNRLEHP